MFAFLDEPSNGAAVTPGIAAAERVERLDDGGSRARHTYEMAGLTFDGEEVRRQVRWTLGNPRAEFGDAEG